MLWASRPWVRVVCPTSSFSQLNNCILHTDSHAHTLKDIHVHSGIHMLRHTKVSVGVCVYIKHLLPACVWDQEKNHYTWSPQVSLAIHCVLLSLCRGLVCSAAPESEREYTPLPGYQNYSSPPPVFTKPMTLQLRLARYPCPCLLWVFLRMALYMCKSLCVAPDLFSHTVCLYPDCEVIASDKCQGLKGRPLFFHNFAWVD